MKPEQEIEDYLCKRVEELGCYCIKLSSVPGIPDRLVCTLDGRNLYVELKCSEGRLNMHQVKTQARLKKMHNEVFNLWSTEEVDDFVNKVILYRS